MIAYLEREEGDAGKNNMSVPVPAQRRSSCHTVFLPFAELLEGRSDDGLRADDAVTSDAHVGQVAADDGVRLHNVLPVKDDVLGAAQHRLAAHAVAGRLERTISRLECTRNGLDCNLRLTVSMYSALLNGISGSSILDRTKGPAPSLPTTPRCRTWSGRTE